MMILSHSAEETRQQAAALAENVQAGDIILLNGDLGAGKTEWVKGFVAAMGGTLEVTSPTFNLVHEYNGGKFLVYHWDLYRLDEKTDWSVLDLDAHLKGSGITIIEWPERYPHRWPSSSWKIFLEIVDTEDRKITCTR